MKNLTPHTITIYSEDGTTILATIPPSGEVARVATTTKSICLVDGIPVYQTKFGEVIGLPAPHGEKFPRRTRDRGQTWMDFIAEPLIVSRLVLEAVKGERTDVYAPGELVRDADGKPIGCKGLSR